MSNDDLDDRDYFWGRVPRKNYVSKRFHDGRDGRLRYFYKTIEGEESIRFAKLGDEVVLRSVNLNRKQIKAKVLEDDRGIQILTIQRLNHLSEPHGEQHFSFIGREIETLKNFLDGIKTVPLEGGHKTYVTYYALADLALSAGQTRRLLAEQPEVIREIINNPNIKRDVMAVGYRRAQIEQFREMMADPRKAEADWQAFFEKNTWIFGYGLSYQFASKLKGRKLETIIRGHDVTGRGKRIDALMRTRGRISSLCLVEIKKPTTPLLDTHYRPGVWSISKDMAGAVAQVQTSVHEAMRAIVGKLEPTDNDGNPTGETLYNFEPKSVLVVGDLSQLAVDGEVNESKLRSFELFRRNTWRPEIITFDELLERAKFIVEHGESEGADEPKDNGIEF